LELSGGVVVFGRAYIGEARARTLEKMRMTNLSFQLEVTGDAAGDREITSIECDPTTEEAKDALEASEIEEGAWEFRFVVAEEFDGTEPVFMRFRRYKLDPEVVFDTCNGAARALQR
jgi:hypothetical protein